MGSGTSVVYSYSEFLPDIKNKINLLVLKKEGLTAFSYL
jgi:hypothetical protein